MVPLHARTTYTRFGKGTNRPQPSTLHPQLPTLNIKPSLQKLRPSDLIAPAWEMHFRKEVQKRFVVIISTIKKCMTTPTPLTRFIVTLKEDFGLL
jgi:hypothetical protein